MISGATLVASAIGGWFAGALSDRYGRVKTLQITIIWFSFFTFLSAFAQSYPRSCWSSRPARLRLRR
jgi:MFS family permease